MRVRFQNHPRMRLLAVILLGSVILGSPFYMLAAENAQVTTVVIPINMAFPLLPTVAIIVNSPSQEGVNKPVIESGSAGIAGIIRVSAGD